MIDGMKAKNTTPAKYGRHILIGVASAAILLVAGIAHAENGVGTAPENPSAEAVYDATQPGADDPRAKAGYDAYEAGDFKRAYDIWLPLAEAGNAEAQFGVGRIFDFGRGLDANKVEAIKWYTVAADQGSLRAHYNLGYIFANKESEYWNTGKAISHFKYAAERGLITAQNSLGIEYAIGQKRYRDYAEAYKWLFIASKNGFAKSNEAIRLLDSDLPKSLRSQGEERMREWLADHPR